MNMTVMKRTFLTLVAVAMLTSCGIYTNYQRPDSVHTDGLYGSAEKPANIKAGISFSAGREIFCFIKIKITIIEEKKYLRTPTLVASTSFKTTFVKTNAVAQKKIAIKAHFFAVNFLYISLKSISLFIPL